MPVGESPDAETTSRRSAAKSRRQDDHKPTNVNIELIVIGKTDSKEIESLLAMYARRINFYCRFAVTVLPDVKNTKNLSAKQQRMTLEDDLLAPDRASHLRRTDIPGFHYPEQRTLPPRMSCPPTKPAIAVITPNILIGLGLRTILEKVGPPGEIAVFDSFTEFIASGPERYFHYFAAMQVFMRHRTFFLENSHKTILLGKGYSAQFARMRQIDIFGGEERLVHDLLCLRSEAPRPDHALPRQNGAPAANLLSVRETEVLTLIAQGLLNKQIADRLQIGLTTVISHRRNIMQKLGVQSVAALVICAVSMGYVDESDIRTPHK